MIFNSKIYLACGGDFLRPSMTFVHFTNGFAYATDAHVLAKQSLEKCFDCSKEEVEMLEGMYIDRESYKFLMKRPLKVYTKSGIRDVEKSKENPNYDPGRQWDPLINNNVIRWKETENYKRVFVTTIFGKSGSKLTVELQDEVVIGGKFPNAELVVSKKFETDVSGKEVWFAPAVLKRGIDCLCHDTQFGQLNIRTIAKDKQAIITSSDFKEEEQVIIVMPVMRSNFVQE